MVCYENKLYAFILSEKKKKKTTINLLRHTNYQVFNVKFEKQIHFKQTNIKDPFLKVNMNPNKQMEKKYK